MEKTAGRFVLCTAFIIVCVTGCSSDDDPGRPPDETPPLPAVSSMTQIEDDAGGRSDWSSDGQLVVFDKVGSDGYHDLWLMAPDGSDKRDLTGAIAGLPQKHMGNPRWHPSGEWIVFIAEKAVHPGGSDLCTPGVGLFNDLWAIKSDGSEYYKLTDLAMGLCLLHPHFSSDGTRLLWCESTSGPANWVIKIAQFVVNGSGVSLANVETLRPGNPPTPVWYETHGFSPDDARILFTANLEPGQHWTGGDIHTYDLASHQLTRLTQSLQDWDEHAQFSPDGSLIVWMSSTGYTFDPQRLNTLRTDFWIMRANGESKTRLTYFNAPGHAEYTGERTICGDICWNPGGSRLLAKVQVGDTKDHVRLVILELE